MASTIMTSIEHEKVNKEKLSKPTIKEEKVEDGKSTGNKQSK